MKTTIIALLASASVLTSSLAASLITIDKEQIIARSKEAICKKYPTIKNDSLELKNLIYQYDSTNGESLKINFRWKEEKPKITTEKKDEHTFITTTEKMYIVSMSSDGSVMSVTEGTSSTGSLSGSSVLKIKAPNNTQTE